LQLFFIVEKNREECYKTKKGKIRYGKNSPDQEITPHPGRKHRQQTSPHSNSPKKTYVARGTPLYYPYNKRDIPQR